MEELLKLTRENNIMLKLIILYINLKENALCLSNNAMQEFVINVLANNIIN